MKVYKNIVVNNGCTEKQLTCQTIICQPLWGVKLIWLDRPPYGTSIAASNAPDATGSIGLLGDLGGTGGGTRILEPAGLSHNTAGKFKVSGCCWLRSVPAMLLPPSLKTMPDATPTEPASTMVDTGPSDTLSTHWESFDALAGKSLGTWIGDPLFGCLKSGKAIAFWN